MSRFRAARLGLVAALTAGFALQGLRAGKAQAPRRIVQIYTWGRANQGQLGHAPDNAAVPSSMHAPGQWTALSSSGDHTLALTADGEVWAWGRNAEGQLGDGTTQDSFLPVRVGTLAGVTLIVAGTFHGLAYRASDGTLWGWGSNVSGQLAEDASVTGSSVPVAIPVPAPLAAISSGGVHSLLLTKDGDVYAWGPNQYGQLGTGDFAERRLPAKVALPGPAVAVAAGGAHSVAALAGSGEVYTWGWNVFGQLGRGTQGTPDRGEPSPAKIASVTGAVELAAGDLHCLARTADGHLWAWGYNTEGQVGAGVVTPANTGILSPVLLGIDSVASIDAGGLHSAALKTNGEVWTWGNNQFGAVGNNARGDQRAPTQPVGLPKAVAVEAGGRHTVALVDANLTTKVVVYGDSTPGEPRTVTRPPVTLDDLEDVAMVRSGFAHTLILDGRHRVWAYGDNAHGQLGMTGGARTAPVAVDVPLDGAAGIVQIDARANRSLALRSDGAVFSWGEGTWGALGLGAKTDLAVPTRITLSTPVVRLTAGERHTLALDRDGVVWGWGQSLHGELGTLSSTERLVPTRVPGVIAPTMIAAGGFHDVAIDLSGALYTWGSGFRGQLGTGTLFDSASPVLVPLPRDVTSVSAGRFHTVVVRQGGAVYAFGDDSECQTGVVPGMDADTSALPVLVTGLPPARAALAGDYHTAVLGYDGEAFGWGNDSASQLGRADGTLPHYDCARAPLGAPGAAAANFVAAGAGRSYVGLSAGAE